MRSSMQFVKFFAIVFPLIERNRALPLVDPGVFVLQGVSTCRSGEGYCLLGLSCTIDNDFIEDDQHGHCKGLTEAFTSQIDFVCCQYVNEHKETMETYDTTLSSYTISEDKFALLDEHPITVPSNVDENISDDIDPSSLINIVGIVTDYTGIIKLITEPYSPTTPSTMMSMHKPTEQISNSSQAQTTTTTEQDDLHFEELFPELAQQEIDVSNPEDIAMNHLETTSEQHRTVASEEEQQNILNNEGMTTEQEIVETEQPKVELDLTKETKPQKEVTEEQSVPITGEKLEKTTEKLVRSTTRTTMQQEVTENYNEIPLDFSFLREQESDSGTEALEGAMSMMTQTATSIADVGIDDVITSPSIMPVETIPVNVLNPDQIDDKHQSNMINGEKNLLEIAIPLKFLEFFKTDETKASAYNDMAVYNQPSTIHGTLEIDETEDLFIITTPVTEPEDEGYGLKLPEEEEEEGTIEENLSKMINKETDPNNQHVLEINNNNIAAVETNTNRIELNHYDHEQLPMNSENIKNKSTTNDELERQPLTDDNLEELQDMSTTLIDVTTVSSSAKETIIPLDTGSVRNLNDESLMRHYDPMVVNPYQYIDIDERIKTRMDDKPFAVNFNYCGIKNVNMQATLAKSLEAVSAFEWCWSAAIVTKNQGQDIFECSGALIEPDLVVTSATCLKRLQGKDVSLYRVILGDSDLRDELPYGVQFHDISEMISHPDYLTSKGSHANDIGLIRLKDYATLDDSVCLICLSQMSAKVPKESCVVSGYTMGDVPVSLRYETGIALPPTGVLRLSPVEIDDNPDCVSSLKKMSLNPLLISNPKAFLCDRKSKVLKQCTNTFDGGSPLACLYNGRWFLTGLASWSKNCSYYPSIYTKVSSYTDWILMTRLRMYGTVLL